MLVKGRSIGARQQGPGLRTAGTGFTCDRRPRVLTLSMIPRSPQYYREIVAFPQPRIQAQPPCPWETRNNYLENYENIRPLANRELIQPSRNPDFLN